MNDVLFIVFTLAFVLGFVWLYVEDFGKSDEFYITMNGNYFYRGEIISCGGNGNLLIVVKEGDCVIKVKPFKP